MHPKRRVRAFAAKAKYLFSREQLCTVCQTVWFFIFNTDGIQINSAPKERILTPHAHPPLQPASVSSPRTKGGGYTLAGRWGGWGVNILEDASHRIGLLQYSLYGFKDKSKDDIAQPLSHSYMWYMYKRKKAQTYKRKK